MHEGELLSLGLAGDVFATKSVALLTKTISSSSCDKVKKSLAVQKNERFKSLASHPFSSMLRSGLEESSDAPEILAQLEKIPHMMEKALSLNINEENEGVDPKILEIARFAAFAQACQQQRHQQVSPFSVFLGLCLCHKERSITDKNISYPILSV